jgi:tripartite-type tricarboxylate transporter receptor subunit TctC
MQAKNRIAAACGTMVSILCATILAQSYPAHPIRLVVPYAPGGPTDIVGRIVAQKLGERLSATVVVDNRPGGTGIIGGEMVAAAAPDGYTLLLCSTSTIVTSPILMGKSAPYQSRRDFAPITLVVTIPYVLLVNPAGGIGSVKELIAAASAKPGELSYGSAGVGSMSHLAGALLSKMAGIDIVHVPYRGSSPSVTDLIGGRLVFIFEAAAAGMQYVKNGRLRALGISTQKRIPGLADLPTISESGVPGYEISTWHGICAPRATPTQVVERLNRAIIAGINAPDIRESLTALGVDVVGSSPNEFAALIGAEITRMEKLLRDLDTKEH